MTLNTAVVFFLIGSLLLTLFAFAIIIGMIVYKKRQQQNVTEKMTLQHVYETQLLQTRLEVQEQSFRYFSEEIHDNIGQILTLARLQLHQLHQYCKDEQPAHLIGQSTELIGKAITDLRNISHTLNSSFIAKAGLVAAIAKELNYLNSVKTTHSRLEISGDTYVFNEEKELLIFRIIQEAMANAIKHGHPSEIVIRLVYAPTLFEVLIADNGQGFDTGKAAEGIGLNNMQLRADLLEGALEIHSTKESGTTVHLTMQPHHVH